MTRRCLALAAALSLLALSGCAVADGVAHLVKLGQGQGKPAAAPAAPAAVQPAAATTDNTPPPPPPAPRDAIGVEELAPLPHG